MINAPFNRHGGLTLVPMPGFESLSERVQRKIEDICKANGSYETPVDIVQPEFGTRSSGEPYLQLGKEHIGGHDVVVLTSGPGTYEMLGQLLLLLGYLAGRRAERICVIAAYFPLARSDKDEGLRELALPPLITHLMEQASYGRLDRIISADLHAPQAVMSGHRVGFLTEVSLTRRILQRAVSDALKVSRRVCLVFPDDGSLKRAEGAAAKVVKELDVNLPIVCGSKRRASSRSSELTGLYGDLEALPESVALAVDDEVATGGTNIEAARALKRYCGAAQVWGVVTHGVLCGSAPREFAAPDCPVDRLYVTDTIPASGRPGLAPLIETGKLVVVPWSDDLGWIIYQHHWDRSIREMR